MSWHLNFKCVSIGGLPKIKEYGIQEYGSLICQLYENKYPAKTFQNYVMKFSVPLVHKSLSS